MDPDETEVLNPLDWWEVPLAIFMLAGLVLLAWWGVTY
jgi:hypothetical protein